MPDIVARIVAVRKENVKYEGTVTYNINNGSTESLNVLENTNLVDGIGGVTWVSKCLHCMQKKKKCYISHPSLYNSYQICRLLGWSAHIVPGY